MGISTHLGPWMLGTVKNTTGTAVGTVANVGATLVTQTYTAPASVITTTPTAQLMFAIPAGAKILRFNVEVTVALTTATNCGLVVGDGTTANKYLTTFNTGATIGKVAQATIDAAMQVAQTNNIGTSDVNFYGTFTAATGNAGAGNIVVTVEYIVRNTDGTLTNP